MIETILVATDFSEDAQRAFERAFDLAGERGAKLYLLHVQTESSLRTAVKEGIFGDASTDEEVLEAVTQLIEERFAQMMSGIDSLQVSIEQTIRRGDPDFVIASYAEEIGADLVVVGRRGAGLVNEMRAVVIGSVTEGVIKKSPCPILVVRREHVWKK